MRLGGVYYGDANTTCRCTSYLIYVADNSDLERFRQSGAIKQPIKQSTAVQYINPYPAGTRQHRYVQNEIDGTPEQNAIDNIGKFNVYIGSRLLGHTVVCLVYFVK